MKQVWGNGERKIKHNFKRRPMLFDYLVMKVTYWIKLSGWKERA